MLLNQKRKAKIPKINKRKKRNVLVVFEILKFNNCLFLFYYRLLSFHFKNKYSSFSKKNIYKKR